MCIRDRGQAGLFYYSDPTPGTANGSGFIGFADMPSFETPGGLYERPLRGDSAVTLTVPAGSTVRYTTDGTDPTETSPLYTGPIEAVSYTHLPGMHRGLPLQHKYC